MLARETEHKRCEICFPRRALARAEGRRRGRSPLFAAGSMRALPWGCESYLGLRGAGGSRDQARMWLLVKSCVSCLGEGEDAVSRWDIVWQYISALSSTAGARGASLAFLANLWSAKHSCRAPRSPRSVAASVNAATPGPCRGNRRRTATCGFVLLPSWSSVKSARKHRLLHR